MVRPSGFFSRFNIRFTFILIIDFALKFSRDRGGGGEGGGGAGGLCLPKILKIIEN